MSADTPQPSDIFKPPYGERDQHVIGAGRNYGYLMIVAFMVHEGYAASHIAKVCEQAYWDSAPFNAVKQFQGRWLVATNFEGNTHLPSWHEYANTLAAYEQRMMPCDVWATTDDPNWLDRNNGIREVRIVHGEPRYVADEIASRIRLVSTGSGTVVSVKPAA